MTNAEARAVSTDAIAKGWAAKVLNLAPKEYIAPLPQDEAELRALAKTYCSELSDWHIQMAYLVADENWERAGNMLASMSIALQKLAGAVSKLMLDKTDAPLAHCEKKE